MKSWRLERPKFGAGIGLHRVGAIADLAGIDLSRWCDRSVNITGSSGKGSVAAMLARTLRGQFASVGLFTSPHLLRMNERFSINGADVEDDALQAGIDRIEAAAQRYERQRRDDYMGGFELLYLTACALFEDAGVDFAVMECGLGGRYDPTRLNRPRLGALVSLALEHTEILGRTVEEIAYDKLDAVAPGGVIYLGEDCWGLRDRILAYCSLTGIEPRLLRRGEDWAEVGDEAHLSFSDGRSARLRPSLAGAHQLANAVIAARLADDVLSTKIRAPLDRVALIETAIADTRWPGRLEVISKNPTVVIDVGHTAPAVAASVAGFNAMRPPGPAILVCGCSIDKDVDGMIAALAPGFDFAIATTAHHKGRPAQGIAERLKRARPSLEVFTISDVAEAQRRAFMLAIEKGASVYVAGGLFLSIEFKAAALGLDPKGLVFF